MNRRGDDGSEMPRQDPFDDAAIDRLLSGQAGTEFGDLASFVEDARTAAEAVPTPSHALASALATGILPVPAPVPQSLWRKSKMKIQGLLAGMSVAGKIALGVGVAAAATTGAGAAGVLPGPVQHVVSSAVGTVTPFELPDGGNHNGGGDVSEPPVDVTTTTSDHHEVTPTSESHDGSGTDTPTTEAHDSTPTTENHDGSGGGNDTPNTEAHDSTPTTEKQTDGSGDGGGDHHETPTTQKSDGGGDGGGGGGGDNHDTTTTTVPHGDVSFTSFSCSYTVGAEHTITCTWTVTGRQDGDIFRLYVNDSYVALNPPMQATYSYSFSPGNPCGGTQYEVALVNHDHTYGHTDGLTATNC